MPWFARLFGIKPWEMDRLTVQQFDDLAQMAMQTMASSMQGG